MDYHNLMVNNDGQLSNCLINQLYLTFREGAC